MTVVVKEFDAQHWVKTRSSLDPNESNFLVWQGGIYAFIPGGKRMRLFKMLGISASRCIPNGEGSWDFTSRELTYYLHPETEELLHKWQNPWSGETVPVMHVANNPVQGTFRGNFPAFVDGENTTFVFDIFATYPNPLAEDKKFVEYSPNPIYQSGELFKITVPTQELLNPEVLSVTHLQLYWDRIGPWVPWMKMGDRPGHLIYSAYGSKVSKFSDLPALLQDEMNTRVPLYKKAAKAPMDVEDMTSWLSFKQNFDAYLAGERFPLPAEEV
jgi:hypothetical protein